MPSNYVLEHVVALYISLGTAVEVTVCGPPSWTQLLLIRGQALRTPTPATREISTLKGAILVSVPSKADLGANWT